MVEAKVSKYEQLRDGQPKPVLLDFGDKGMLAITPNATKRIADGKIFQGVRINSGFQGDLGFVRGKFNSTVELRRGLTQDDFGKLWKAYEKIDNAMPKND